MKTDQEFVGDSVVGGFVTNQVELVNNSGDRIDK